MAGIRDGREEGDGAVPFKRSHAIIRLLVEVQHDPAWFAKLRGGDRELMALVLNRFDLLKDATMVEAVTRCMWWKAALHVQRLRLPSGNEQEAEQRELIDTMLPETIEPEVIVVVDEVERNPAVFATLRTEQRLMVALVLNRFDLLQDFTILEAVHWLGEDRVEMALAVQKTRRLSVAGPR
jgi:hypothetical protein